MALWREATSEVEVVSRAAADGRALPVGLFLFVPRALGASEAGSDPGPQLLFLHGVGNTADLWRGVLNHWPATGPIAPAIALDLPGHGKSGAFCSGAYTTENFADTVIEALKAVGVGRAVIIGHSIGAKIALQIAAREPTSVQALLLIDFNPSLSGAVTELVDSHVERLYSGAPSRAELGALLAQQLPLGDPAAIESWLHHAAVRSGNLWRIPLDPSVKQILKQDLAGEAAWSALRGFAGPIGLIRGQFSSVLTQSVAHQIEGAIPWHVGSETISRAGHAILLEQPAALAQAMQRLLCKFNSSSAG